MKALVGTFKQEKALVGAFSVIVKHCVIFGNLGFKLLVQEKYRTAPTFREFVSYLVDLPLSR